jgi:hypothetical protein
MTQTSVVASPAVWEIPGRSQAEEALAVAHTSDRRSFFKAAVFLPDHVPDFIEEGRFDLADRALLAYCQALVKVLPPNARLYRWSATALMVLVVQSAPDSADPIPFLPELGRRRYFPLAEGTDFASLCREVDLHIACRI